MLVSMITIMTKNQTEAEVKTKALLEKVLAEYNCPIFTNEVLIEHGAIPHSHPILTLNTRQNELILILATFVHEQYHWFATSHKQYINCINYLKEAYTDLGDCNKSGNYPNSFWEHLIVCWNTRNFLEKNLTEQEVEFIYSQWQAYPLTEAFVKANFKEIETNLQKFSMTY